MAGKPLPSTTGTGTLGPVAPISTSPRVHAMGGPGKAMGNPTQTPAAVTDPTSGMPINPKTGQPVMQDPAMLEGMQQAQSGQMQAEQQAQQAEQQRTIEAEKQKAEAETTESRHKLEIQSMKEQMKLKDMEANMTKKLQSIGPKTESATGAPVLSPSLVSRIDSIKGRISKVSRPNAATQAKMVMASIKAAALEPASGLSSSATGVQLRSPQEAQARTQAHQNQQIQRMNQRGTAAVAERRQQQVDDRAYAQQQVATTGQQQVPGGATHYYTDRPGAAATMAAGGQPRADMVTMPIDPRYGGGMAMGGQSLPAVQAQTQLPTQSGVPMSALEAIQTGHQGSGIYGNPREAGGALAQAGAMDAASARGVLRNQGIQQRIEEFNQQRGIAAPPVAAPPAAPVAAAPPTTPPTPAPVSQLAATSQPPAAPAGGLAWPAPFNMNYGPGSLQDEGGAVGPAMIDDGAAGPGASPSAAQIQGAAAGEPTQLAEAAPIGSPSPTPAPQQAPQEYLYGLSPDALYGEAPMSGIAGQTYSPITSDQEGETGVQMMQRYLTGEGVDPGERNWAARTAAQRFLDRRGVGSHNEAADYFTQLYGPQVGQELAQRVFQLGNEKLKSDFLGQQDAQAEKDTGWGTLLNPWANRSTDTWQNEVTGADEYEMMNALMPEQKHYGTTGKGTLTPEQRIENASHVIDRLNREQQANREFSHKMMWDQDDVGAMMRNYGSMEAEKMQENDPLRNVPGLNWTNDRIRRGQQAFMGMYGDATDATAARMNGDWGRWGDEIANGALSGAEGVWSSAPVPAFAALDGGASMISNKMTDQTRQNHPLLSGIIDGMGTATPAMSRQKAMQEGLYTGVDSFEGGTNVGDWNSLRDAGKSYLNDKWGTNFELPDLSDPQQRELLGQFENVIPRQEGEAPEAWYTRVMEMAPLLMQMFGFGGGGGRGGDGMGTDPYTGMPSTENEYYSGMYPNYGGH